MWNVLQLYTNPKSSGEVRARTSCALKQSLQCCLHRPALEPLLHSAPAGILKYVLAQYAKVGCLVGLNVYKSYVFLKFLK